ncbi:MAG: hypothetical protein U0527_05895 [Candidatus Eisenbacteria bacterium]
MTRRTGDLGVPAPGATRPANQTQDGRIEQLERELGGTWLELGETTTDLDQLNRGNLAIEENDARRIGLKRSREDRAACLASLSAWVRLDEERRRRVDEEGRWAAAERELSTVDQERAALRAILGGEGERFRASGPELPTALDALARAADEEARARDEAARIRQERAELDQALARAEAACREAGEALPTPAWDTIEWASKAFLGELDRYDQATARLSLLERHGEARAFLESENRSARLEAKLALVDARKELAGQLREAKSELLIAEERQKEAKRGSTPFVQPRRPSGSSSTSRSSRPPRPLLTSLRVAGGRLQPGSQSREPPSSSSAARAAFGGGREREEEERRLAGHVQRAGEARAHATNLENEAARIERDIASLDHQLGPFAAPTAAEFAEESRAGGKRTRSARGSGRSARISFT